MFVIVVHKPNDPIYNYYVKEQICESFEDAKDFINDMKFHNDFPNSIYSIYEIKKIKEVES